MLRGCTAFLQEAEGRGTRQAGRQVCSPLGLTYNGVPRPSTIHTRNLIQLSKVNGLCATYVTVNVAIVCN